MSVPCFEYRAKQIYVIEKKKLRRNVYETEERFRKKEEKKKEKREAFDGVRKQQIIVVDWG